jgi:integrating conjugative element membrane protein (TIGR03747 family)
MGFARVLMNWPVEYRQRTAQARGDLKGPVATDAGAELVLRELATAGSTWAMLVSGTYIFAVRTAMYVSALPLLLLGGAVGLIDGLMAHARRKALAGRESASLYHRAKLGLSFIPIMGYLLCLALPSLDEPAPVLVPVALAMAALVRLQCTYYKKYL